MESQTAVNAPDQTSALDWQALGLAPEVLESVRKAGFTQPTPIQAKAIPLAVEKWDIIASAQTGTGKTAAFSLPMIQQFKGRQGTFGLVMAPTREIAQQIQSNIELLGGPLGIRSIVLIGGINMRRDAEAILTYPHIIVATPGRLCDHLDRGNIWLDYLEVVVLDEADRMLDMGFSAQLSRIMEEVPQRRQTLLFSATIPKSVQKLAEKILFEPKSVSVDPPLSTAERVTQRLLYMKEESKSRELQRLIRKESGSIIVFTRSKDGATRVWRSLHSAGFYEATYIHSDRPQKDRESALAEFKEGKFRVLIATDVAARGLHIDGVAHVVNYDLPMEPESYVHRIGRTGRAGASGVSTTFVTSRDRALLDDIEKLIGTKIPAEYTQSHPTADSGPSDDRGRNSSRPSRASSNRKPQSSTRPSTRPSQNGAAPKPTPAGEAGARPTIRPQTASARPAQNGVSQQGSRSAPGAHKPISALDFMSRMAPPPIEATVEIEAPSRSAEQEPGEIKKRRRRGGRGRRKPAGASSDTSGSSSGGSPKDGE